MRIPDPVYPSVVHMLARAGGGGSRVEALVCGDRRLGYGEYLSCVAGFARELHVRGVRGERVATLLGNSIEKSQRQTTSYQINLRMDDGSIRTIAADTLPSWRIGDKVKLVGGTIVAR